MSNQSLNIMSNPVGIVGSSMGIPGSLTGLTHATIKPTSGLAIPAYWQAWGHGCQWLRRRLLSLSKTISLVWMLGRARVLFWHFCKDWRKPFFQWFQNSFGKFWTLRHLLWEYRSAHLKSPVVAREGLLSLSVDDLAWVVLVKTASSIHLQSVIYYWLSPLPCTWKSKAIHHLTVGQNFPKVHIG